MKEKIAHLESKPTPVTTPSSTAPSYPDLSPKVAELKGQVDGLQKEKTENVDKIRKMTQSLQVYLHKWKYFILITN
jgi:hypothetical protein